MDKRNHMGKDKEGVIVICNFIEEIKKEFQL
jgi:hypothetical protein